MDRKIDHSELMKRMLSKNLNLVSLSKLAGISRTTLYNIKNGKPFRYSTIELIAEALSCDPEDIVLMEDESNG